MGLPSGVRGTPGVGYDGHCAYKEDDTATQMAIAPASLLAQFTT
jgi:hypothetical protein